jgi:Mg-chelatase subunit ChlD
MKILLWAAVFALASSFSIVTAQSPRETPRARDQKSAIPADQPESAQDVETLKIDTNLVTVPVIASSRTGAYITDVRKEEFKLSEDGVPQEIAFFATVNAPFHVVLLLDTSDSTQEKLVKIQQSAIAFLNQLGSQDRVKVISFDGELHDWNDFTSDKTILRNAIEQTRSGHDTRVYDAVQMALDALRPIQQRKAIVIFTDGMDWHSESSTSESTIHDVDESGVIVYPIRFDTRDETERLARKQQQETNGSQLPTSDIIRQSPNGTTPTTFPSDEPFPTKGTPRASLPLPPPSVIFGRGNLPPGSSPDDPNPNTDPRSGRTDPRDPNRRTGRNDPTMGSDPSTINNRRRDDSLSAMLDNLYLMADGYLKDLADRSGGQLYRADTVTVLPQAFAAIAAELRTQYLLGYYPTNREHDGAYRKIQVKTSRKDIAIRSRPGYRAKTGV